MNAPAAAPADQSNAPAWVRHRGLRQWVSEIARLAKPERIVWCDGSEAEYDRLCARAGRLRHVHPAQSRSAGPTRFLARSHPSDVARMEDRTFICSQNKEDAGPTNNWIDPSEMRRTLNRLFDGCMRGRTMYVMPFSMGPIGSHIAQIGVEISDSAVCRRQHADHDAHGPRGRRVARRGPASSCRACTRSARRSRLGRRTCLAVQRQGQVDRPFPGDARDLVVRLGLRRQRAPRQEVPRAAHRIGDGARRRLARRAHADPRHAGARRREDLCRGRVSVRVRQDQSRDADPAAGVCQGWKVTTIGEDIAWIKPGKDGRLYAINPEYGLFGVAPGTSEQTNPNAMKMLHSNVIFTNVALTPDGDVWWEGHDRAAAGAASSTGRARPGRRKTARKGGSRRIRTRASRFLPRSARRWIRTGRIRPACRSRRSSSAAGARPPCRSWSKRRAGKTGVYMAATLGSETTAAITGKVGVVRRDPMAMLAFCGYNMGDYFGHWLKMGRAARSSRRRSSA